ncbi:hypothetical protein AYI68_g3381 [Smittium mucronatum]|uniref:Uncharacterized protein n=1 Tax=Smittium mucronatum TaxID=133383 RepID=A0A1R0H026_9FUNG|nr:hypothetical protein AYI68_g3381 [Smittium mucronatum]
MKRCYEKKFTLKKYPTGRWDMVKNETRKKYDGKFLGPFKILYNGSFQTYKLATAAGDTQRVLINYNRFQIGNVATETTVNSWIENTVLFDKSYN